MVTFEKWKLRHTHGHIRKLTFQNVRCSTVRHVYGEVFLSRIPLLSGPSLLTFRYVEILVSWLFSLLKLNFLIELIFIRVNNEILFFIELFSPTFSSNSDDSILSVPVLLFFTCF